MSGNLDGQFRRHRWAMPGGNECYERWIVADSEAAIDPVAARVNGAGGNPDRNRDGALAPEHPLDTIDDAIEDGAVVGALIHHDDSPSAVGDGALRASLCITITHRDRLWFLFRDDDCR